MCPVEKRKKRNHEAHASPAPPRSPAHPALYPAGIYSGDKGAGLASPLHDSPSKVTSPECILYNAGVTSALSALPCQGSGPSLGPGRAPGDVTDKVRLGTVQYSLSPRAGVGTWLLGKVASGVLY